MGKHTAQNVVRFRREIKSIWQHKVKAKCPLCGKMHTVLVGSIPVILLRIYCPRCREYIERQESGLENDGNNPLI